MVTEVKFDLSDVDTIIRKHGLGPGGSVQKFFSNELLRISAPYTPFSSGILKGTAFISQDGTSIYYNTPYARYLWYGKLMVDPITGKGAFFKEGYGFWSRPKAQKELTNIDLKFHPEGTIRCSRWVERAYIENKQTILESVEKFVNRR